jgi:transposase-like protein
MNIIAHAQQFVQSLRELACRSAWDWRRCPRCGSTLTSCHGSYSRHPWFLDGRRAVRVQRHRCQACRRTYSERSPLLVAGSWYAREVHRLAIDHWQHAGTSLRRTAEVARSWLGRQERWLFWRPLDTPPCADKCCTLSASTVQRWLDGAGRRAQAGLAQQLAGVPTSGQLATDGLWARLRAGAKRVVLVLTDSASGLVWPPVVVAGEERGADWAPLFARAAAAGLDLEGVRGLTSDGASGLVSYLTRVLYWWNHQRCVWHLWRNLGGGLHAVEEVTCTPRTGPVGK